MRKRRSVLEPGAAIPFAAATLLIAPAAASAFTSEQKQLMRGWVQLLVDDGSARRSASVSRTK